MPEPGPGQVLVAVAGNGLCHSDALMSQMPGAIGESIGWKVPFTLGHEIGGRVASLGAGVSGFAEGDPVAVISPSSCGHCTFCVRGEDNNCADSLVGRGYGRDGGLASYVLVSSTRELVKLTTLDPVSAGPLTDAGATSYHAVKRALPDPTGRHGRGDRCRRTRQLRRAAPAGPDLGPGGRHRPGARTAGLCRRTGCPRHPGGRRLDTAGEVLALTGDGADAVFDFVGIGPTIRAGLRSTRRGGAFALIGAGQGGLPDVSLYDILPKDGEVFTFQASTIADALDVIALADSGRIRADVDLFPLDRVAEAYEAMEAGTLRGRAVVVPG